MIARLRRATIWHPDAFPPEASATDRELKRFTLPVFDVLMVLMGVAGVNLGMPSFQAVFRADVSVYAGVVLIVAGLAALAGISFPRLWLAEAIGKVLMLIVLGGYAVAMWVLNFQGIGERWIVALAFTGLLLLPLWNLVRLGRERRARHLARRAREAMERAMREAVG